MGLCNLTRKIPSTQCIGDSLRTINANFSALEVGLCSLPALVEGQGFDLDLKLSPNTNQTYLELSPVYSPVYETEFESYSNIVSLTSLSLQDGTSLHSYKFPYKPIPQDTKPLGVFTSIAQQAGYPRLTLFWTASGDQQLTTAYNLNSADSLNVTVPTETDGEVLCFLRDNDTLYIGGSFNKLGADTIPKIASISLSSGYLQSGFPDSQLSGIPTLQIGSVKALAQFEAEISTFSGPVTQKFLVLGGDFISNTAGRGLIVYNQTLKFIKQAYYFNGEVNDVVVDTNQNSLYVVGQFDWANLGATPATEASGDRVYCNNFAKIGLSLVDTVDAFDQEFIANSAQVLKNSVSLNTAAFYGDSIYLGGELQIQSDTGEIFHKNLVCLRRSTNTELNLKKGTLVQTCKFIFDKPVYNLLVDNSTLYVGGQFTVAASYDDFYNFNLVDREQRIKCYHAVSINLVNFFGPVINFIWKPRFNDIVYKWEVTDSNYDSFIYALGAFTSVNNNAVSNIAAVTKATSLLGNTSQGISVPWNVYINAGPTTNTNALFRADSNSLFVGGNFLKVNNQVRKYYARVPGANQHITETNPETVQFEFGGQIIDQGRSPTFDFSSVESVTQTTGSGPMYTINKTTFPLLTKTFKGVERNKLCRFYIKRNGTNDALLKDVYILGWSLTYEKNNN